MGKLYYVERWEERTYKINEVVYLDECHDRVGDICYQTESPREVVDRGEIVMMPWEDVSSDHWIRKVYTPKSEIESDEAIHQIVDCLGEVDIKFLQLVYEQVCNSHTLVKEIK